MGQMAFQSVIELVHDCREIPDLTMADAMSRERHERRRGLLPSGLLHVRANVD